MYGKSFSNILRTFPKKGGQKPNEEVEKNLKIVKIVNKLYEKTRIHRAEVEQEMVLERVNKQ